MKTSSSLLLIGFAILPFFCFHSGAVANPFSEHDYFSKVVGEWKGKGEMTTADGTIITVTEELKMRSEEDGTYVIEGARKWNEDQQDFKWVFSFNSSSDQFECEYQHTGMDNPIRFEVSVVGQKIEMRTPFGNSGNELLISHELMGEDVHGIVNLSSPDGQSFLSGTVDYSRVQS